MSLHGRTGLKLEDNPKSGQQICMEDDDS